MTLYSIKSTLGPSLCEARKNAALGLEKAWNYTKKNPKKVVLTTLALGVAGLAIRYLVNSYHLYHVEIPARIKELTDPNSDKYDPSFCTCNTSFGTYIGTKRARTFWHSAPSSFLLNFIPDSFLTQKVYFIGEKCASSCVESCPAKPCSDTMIKKYIFEPLPFSDWLTSLVETNLVGRK